MLSVIVPTRNERENIPPLVAALSEALRDIPYEICFVDDSTDDTPDILAEAAAQDVRLRVIHRTSGTGLATAVAEGFRRSSGEVLAVLDADLQHPPEFLPTLVASLDRADVAIASRFVPGGSDGGLGPGRKAVSAVARSLGRLALRRIRSVRDPTAGFFALRREVLEGVTLRPLGWKILMEVLQRGNVHSVVEVPYAFRPRTMGRSKLTLREEGVYLRHLARLVRESRGDRRLFVFLIGGAVGTLENAAIDAALLALGAPPVTSGAVAALAAALGNFLFHDHITWAGHHLGSSWGRLAKFLVTSSVAILLDVAVLTLLTRAGTEPHLANLAGIAGGTAWTYLISGHWTWPAEEGPLRHAVLAPSGASQPPEGTDTPLEELGG